MRRIVFAIILTSTLIFAGTAKAAESSSGVVKATLNKLEITCDAQNGSIVGLKYPGVGTLLEASADQASIVDLAYPIEEYPPLRLAPRFSKNVQITKTDDSVTLFWPKLGPSMAFDLTGEVYATVVLKAAPDGQSVIMTCQIDNQSQHSVRQVLFPDLMGLLPFAGTQETKFTTAGSSIAPFEILKTPAERPSYFYAVEEFYRGSNWIEFTAGSYNDQSYYQSTQKIQGVPRAPGIDATPGGTSHMMILDWVEFGSSKGGLSLYPRRWGWDYRPTVMLHLSPQTNKLRMLYQYGQWNSGDVAPGAKWQSQEYWLTPHKFGWAEGIKPYSQWASEHVNRRFPVPERIKKSMGYRTIFMSTGTVVDDKDIICKFSDLPAVARECAEHGIDELVLWAWGSGWHSETDSTPPHITIVPSLGTIGDFTDAAKKCREMEVNVTPFISVVVMPEPRASRFGVKVSKDYSWAYHHDMIPQFNPYYKLSGDLGFADTSDEAWRKEVLTSIKTLVDAGFPSLAWDVFLGEVKASNIYTLTDEIRALAVQRDPQASFAAESINNIDLEANHLDYTWNWMRYEDIRPFNNVFSAPRLNANIDNSSKEVKLCFIDNVYMNIMPTVPGNVNGSDTIANNPPLSKTLKQCSKLRKQFMDYFTRGKLIGDCILTAPPPKGFHVSAYVLPESILMLVLNTSDGNLKMPLECDLSNWLPSDTGKYEVKRYNSDGRLIREKEFDHYKWKSKSSVLQSYDMEIFEFWAK